MKKDEDPVRPVSSPRKISERLLSDLAVVWEKHGPGKLACGLLPRDVLVSVANTGPGNVTSDASALLLPAGWKNTVAQS